MELKHGRQKLKAIQEQLYTVELTSAQMAKESSNIKEEIKTMITQEITEKKTRMAQETTAITKRMAPVVKTMRIPRERVMKPMMVPNSPLLKIPKPSLVEIPETQLIDIPDTPLIEIPKDCTTRMAQETTKKHIDTRIKDMSETFSSQIGQDIIKIQKEEWSSDDWSEESSDSEDGITTMITQDTTEMKQIRMKNVSTPFRSRIKQNKGKQQMERRKKRKKLLENTENSIKVHINENTFVHTNAVNEALARVKQNGIVIIIGSPGSGKSRIGLELLRQISMDNKTRRSIQLDDISQWQYISDDMGAVLIDDVFGKTNCSYNENVHPKLLEMIFTTIQNKNLKVILTLRTNIYRAISTITESHRIFHDHHVLDLNSGKNQMTVKEKKSCLVNYLTKNKILKTDDIKKKNINGDSILDTASTVYLHKDTLQTILHSDIGTQIGFPETCYLFASRWKFTKQGRNFFCHPIEHLSKEIDNLRIEGDTNKNSMIDFTLLVYILLNDYSVNIDEIDMDAFRRVMDIMYLNPLSTIPILYINDSAKRLSGKYLKINNDGNYCFQHRLISEVVMISCSFTDPRRVIPLFGFDFITEITRPQFYRPCEGEVIFTVPVSCYSLLAQRILQLLETGYKKEPYLFVQNLCKSKIITMTGNNILQEMITQYKYKRSHYQLKLILDHRFSGRDPYYYVDESYFYLPSALMMFCNIDDDSVYQCLYESIHTTLTSESDSGAMKACKESLVITFSFAICTLEVKRSTVILKILTDHNIKQHHQTLPFYNNIVRHQGVPGVQLILTLHDIAHVFDITLLFSQIFQNCINEINIDDNMKQFITSVIENNSHDRCPVRAIVRFVCRQGQLDFVKDVCERFDSTLFDVDDMIIMACRGRNNGVIQWLMEKYHGLYNLQRVLDGACRYGCIECVQTIFEMFDHALLDLKSAIKNGCMSGDTELIKWLCEKCDHNLFDMKSVMNKACRRSTTELVQWLWEKCDHNLFDIRSAMNNACESGNTGLVNWLCVKFDKSLFDMKSAMNNACERGNTGLVKWLCEKFDNNLFDMKSAMNNASSGGDTELVKLLCEKFDNSLFDMKTAMNNACKRYNTELVKWLWEKFDNNVFDMKSAIINACERGDHGLVKWLWENNLFDMKTVMNNACTEGDTGLVKWLCDKFDTSLFDMKTAMNNACSWGNPGLVKWLCEKIDISLFDMKTVMKHACTSGNIGLVKWLCEKFDNNLFDMKTAMNNACSSWGNTELVKWLCEKFDTSLFDMKTAMNNAGSNRNTELVKWLCEKFDTRLFDMKTAMNNACSNKNTELVEWLCEKFDTCLFDMKRSMNYACNSRHNTELVKWLCEKFDTSLFDMKTAMNNTCSNRNTELVKWLCEKFDTRLFDMKTAMNNTCRSRNIELVKWLCEKFEHDLFDMKTAMNNACSIWGNTELVKWLCETFDTSVFDMKTAMNNACSYRNTELVKWLCEKFENDLFDMKTAMNNACTSGDTELVKWLCQKFDTSLFDMKTAMNNACNSWGKTELVKWLCEKFDTSLFNMKTAMNNACSSLGNTELVKWLCEKFDTSLFDMKKVMNNACKSGDTELVKWLCETFDTSVFDMKTAMNNACSYSNTELVEWLCEKFENDLFDMKTAMNNACTSGDTELVKWLCEKFDTSLFDMKKVMNNACKSGDTELVKWLCETFDTSVFDMKTAMNNACSYRNTELVKWLCEKFENDLFDMKTAMNNACTSGDTELVKWLCEKFDTSLFDMKTAMINASRGYKNEIVKWLVQESAGITTKLALEMTRITQQRFDIKEHINKRTKDMSVTFSNQIGQDTVRQQIEEKKKRLLDGFHVLSIQCDQILVDCIVDRRIQFKYNHLYQDIEQFERRKFIRKSHENEFYMQNMTAELDLSDIATYYTDFEILYAFSKMCPRQIDESKLLKIAIKTRQDLVCRWLLSHCSNSRLAVSIRPTKVDPAICRALSWTYTKLFHKQHISALSNCSSIWPGTKCKCKNKEHDTNMCFKKGRLVIVVESGTNICGLPPKFGGFRIQHITPEIRFKASKEASTILKTKLDKNSYYMNKYVAGDIAEKLFKNHRNLTLLCPSPYKSQGYYQNHRVTPCMCMQLFCRVKGIVPVGENHFPSQINGMETDVLEGCPRLAIDIRVGDKIGTLTSTGTLGGFYSYMGKTCFLTCAHVMYDVSNLLKSSYDFHRNRAMKSYIHTPTGVVECGRTIRRVFDHDDNQKTSVDAVLVEIDASHLVNPIDLIRDAHGNQGTFQSLGMASIFLEDNCLDHRSLVNQPNITAVAAGAMTRHAQYIGGKLEDATDIYFSNIGQAQAQVNGVNYQPLLLINHAHMQVPIGALQGQRIFRMYKQMVVNVPLQAGDSGTCIYITGSPAGTGCIGMAVAHCSGFAIVTPLTEILSRL